jgi:hypothetical protein
MRQNEAQLHIENPRNHPTESVAKLRALLGSAAPLREDPRRPNFFELDDHDCVFYLYISPATGTVTLLATWAQEFEPALVG